jgi:multimeric flavodoxin WrbA
MTYVLAVSGSRRMEKSNTTAILNPFLEGMRESGASVDLQYLQNLNIKPCMGDFHCWREKPGECIQSDDMDMLYPKLRRADILVIATPVYVPLPSQMQNFLNRLVPLLKPDLVVREGRTRARFHEDVAIGQIVLVSTSGWWELGNFGTVVRIAKEFSEDAGVEFAGAVLRPHFSLMKENGEKRREVLGASRKAGRQLVGNGSMSDDTLQKVSQPLISQTDWMAA